LSGVRPQRHALTGDTGLARSIHGLRVDVGLPVPSLGDIKNAISDSEMVRGWLVVVPPKSWRVSYAASGLVLDSLIS
jgi:hypothetical protein